MAHMINTELSATLKNHLLSLGSTPDEIATTLLSLNLKGNRDRNGNSPIDIYIKRQMPEAYKTFVGYNWADIEDNNHNVIALFAYSTKNNDGKYLLPLPVFMKLFIDDGKYPELAL